VGPVLPTPLVAGAARLAWSSCLTSMNAADRWFFAGNYGEVSEPKGTGIGTPVTAARTGKISS
jgi:isochorismate synthase EntC